MRWATRLSSSSSEPEPNLTSDKTKHKLIYQRSFYRLPLSTADYDQAGDDEDDLAYLEIPQPMVIEERVRYQIVADDDKDESDTDDDDGGKTAVPIGPRTLILREGQEEAGKIGNAFCAIHLYEKNNEQSSHMRPTSTASWRATMALALYLSANPSKLVNDQVLQVECGLDWGLPTLLGCLGAAQALKQQQQVGSATSAPKEEQENAAWLGESSFSSGDTVLFPESVRQITLTDSNVEQVEETLKMLKSAGLLPSSTFSSSGSSVVVEEMQWNTRRQTLSSANSMRMKKEYNTIIASDGLYSTYPEAKELARTVAHSLKASQPFFVNGASCCCLLDVNSAPVA